MTLFFATLHKYFVIGLEPECSISFSIVIFLRSLINASICVFHFTFPTPHVPGGGDELQGIKKGIVELADIILVNKADGALENIAKISAQDYRNALHLLRPATPNWSVPVQTCSALQEQGITEVWQKVIEFQKKLGTSGEITHRRAEQAKAWLWTELSDGMLTQLRQHPKAASELAKIESDIAKGTRSPVAAARRLINIFLGRET